MCLCDSPRLLRLLVPPTAGAGAAVTADGGDDTAAAATVEGGDGEEKVGAAGGSGESASDDSKAKLVMSQLALSDRVLLNKSDLLTPAEVRTLNTLETTRFLTVLPQHSRCVPTVVLPKLCVSCCV